MTTQILRRNIRLLIINPNSSHDMTHGMEQAIRAIDLPDSLEITLYTAPPTSPSSIDNDKDIEASTTAVLENLTESFTTINTTTNNAVLLLKDYDGVLIACYSSHTLVPLLAARCPHLAVTGIFEASIVATLPLLLPPHPHPHLHQKGQGEGEGQGQGQGGGGKWGIVTTGKFWEDHLRVAVERFLGQPSSSTEGQQAPKNLNFSGVFSTGLTAGDFHGGKVTPEVIRAKMKEATQALLRTGRVECVVMGCAGMAGLENVIRAAIKDEYEPNAAAKVHILDGVRAGVGVLEQMVKHRRMFLAD